MRIDLKTLAKRLGVTVPAVRNAAAQGRITVGPDGTVDPLEALREWETGARPSGPAQKKGGRPKGAKNAPKGPVAASVKGPGRIDPRTNLREAMRVERVAKAERQQLEVARLRAELLPRDRVLRSVETWGKVWRDGLLALPTACAEELAAAFGVSAPTVIVELDRVVRDFLEGMSGHAFRLADETDRAVGGAS